MIHEKLFLRTYQILTNVHLRQQHLRSKMENRQQKFISFNPGSTEAISIYFPIDLVTAEL